MKLAEVEVINPGQLMKARKLADKATKVVISGIDSIVGKDNLGDEYQYFRMIKTMIDKRFEQILIKRQQRVSKASHSKR